MKALLKPIVRGFSEIRITLCLVPRHHDNLFYLAITRFGSSLVKQLAHWLAIEDGTCDDAYRSPPPSFGFEPHDVLLISQLLLLTPQ